MTRSRSKNSPYHGITFLSKARRPTWKSQIGVRVVGGGWTNLWLGDFHSPEEAARAYDAAAVVWRETPRLNFPDDYAHIASNANQNQGLRAA